jgi:hypothetical protein
VRGDERLVRQFRFEPAQQTVDSILQGRDEHGHELGVAAHVVELVGSRFERQAAHLACVQHRQQRPRLRRDRGALGRRAARHQRLCGHAEVRDNRLAPGGAQRK